MIKEENYSLFAMVNTKTGTYLTTKGAVRLLSAMETSDLFTNERAARAGLTKEKNHVEVGLNFAKDKTKAIKDGTEPFFKPEALPRFEADVEFYTELFESLKDYEVKEIVIKTQYNFK